MTSLEEEVLWACADDYESPRSIYAGIGERTEQPVTEASVRGILLSLADRGYVQACRHDKASGQWVALSPAAAAKDADPWFITTDKGKEEIEDDGD